MKGPYFRLLKTHGFLETNEGGIHEDALPFLINADETSVRLQSPNQKPVGPGDMTHIISPKESTTGDHISVMVTLAADGSVFPPFTLLKVKSKSCKSKLNSYVKTD